MTLNPDLEALVQGALDDTLTAGERERLDRVMQENVEVRGRVAHLEQLTALLDSLGSAQPPADLVPGVLAQISNPSDHQSADRLSAGQRSAGARGHAEARSGGRVAAFPIPSARSVRSSSSTRGIAVNKKILLGLAAAAVVVLAVVTFRGYPPADEGTEATIGAAQRYQAPQIEAKDVAVGDTSAQAILQTETWDAIVKDETLRKQLQDASLRARLQDAGLRQALSDADILRALRDPQLKRKLNDAALVRALSDENLRSALEDAEVRKTLSDQEMARALNDENLRAALRNPAFVDALRDAEFRQRLVNTDLAAALASPALQAALRDRGFEAALRKPQFAEAMISPASCPKWICGANSPHQKGYVISANPAK